MRLLQVIVSIAALYLLAALPSIVQASDITVDSSCSLADAINAANSDTATGNCPAGSDADTIALTTNVTLTAALPEIESEITIEGNGYTISGNERHQIFWVEETGALTIQNATLVDGRGADDDDLFDEDVLIGGAIVNLGSLDVSDSVFTGNSSDWGGAIYNFESADIDIRNSGFMGNTAKAAGAIYNANEATVSIWDSKFTSNSTVDRPGSGGAIYNLGDLMINNSAFSGNSAFWEGGAISNIGEASFKNSTFTENHSRDGGAINCDGYSGTHNSEGLAILQIEDSHFTSNSADSQGGAIFYARAEANVNMSTFSNNTAEGGGAINNNWGSNISISDSIFTGNSAVTGGALSNHEKAKISRSNFIGNSTEQDGGAINITNHASISNSMFTDNSAGDEGGAVRITEDSDVKVTHSVFVDNTAEDGGAIYSWGELIVSHSTFTNNSASEEGGAIANHGEASIKDSILAGNPGGDCHLGRNGELLASSNNHISDGSCGAVWSGPIADGYCPPGQEQDGVCQIGAPS